MSRRALEVLQERFAAGILATHDFRGDETAIIERSLVAPACRFLKEESGLGFNMLTDMTAVDHLPRVPRFEVVYHLYSVGGKMRVRLKAPVPEEEPELETLSAVFPIANWLEREIWDMYGIRFRGHPDLRRILLYEDFKGHPLRKDYPKEKHQPIVRRPEGELAEVMARRGKARPLTRPADLKGGARS